MTGARCQEKWLVSSFSATPNPDHRHLSGLPSQSHENLVLRPFSCHHAFGGSRWRSFRLAIPIPSSRDSYPIVSRKLSFRRAFPILSRGECIVLARPKRLFRLRTDRYREAGIYVFSVRWCISAIYKFCHFRRISHRQALVLKYGEHASMFFKIFHHDFFHLPPRARGRGPPPRSRWRRVTEEKPVWCNSS